MRRRRLSALGYLAVAAAVHVAALLVARAPSSPVAASPEAPLEFEVEPAAPSLEATATPVSPPLARGVEVAKIDVARTATAGVRSLPETGGETGAPEAPSATAAPAESSAWTLQAERPADVTNPAFIARAVRPAVAERANEGVSTTGGLVEGLDAHDVEVGLGRGGPVITALENAAASEAAPFEGAATFDFAIQSDGHVSMAVLDATSSLEDWNKVGEATRKALDPKAVRIPPGARGWHVVVRVEAKVQFPNGLDPNKLGARFTASPTGVTFAATGKVCSVRVTAGLTLVPITGGCDPSNIGVRPLRVVHGHATAEGRL
ncbi:MAG TPA: hypothetical protein VGM06_18400 [Polyangiaceae bacterium]|jgi:hypothetical protein